MSALDPFALGGWQSADQVLALIAEEERLRLQACKLEAEAMAIYRALPDDIQRGPKILLKSRRGDAVPKSTDEISWHPYHFDGEQALLEWFDSTSMRGLRFGLSDARRAELLAEFRADEARINAVLEASGYAAAQAEADETLERACELFDQIKTTTPTTLAGVVAMLELIGANADPLMAQALAGLREIGAEGGRP